MTISYLQCGIYGILICGLNSGLVWFGYNQIPFSIFVLRKLIARIIVWYLLLLQFLICLAKFLFICVWKHMKQMNDDLITQICIVWVTFISIWISIGSLYDEGIDRDIRHNMGNMITWQTVTPRVGQMFYLKSNRLSIRSLGFSNFWSWYNIFYWPFNSTNV